MPDPADLPLRPEDRRLVGTAVELLRARFVPGRHEVAAAVRMRSGAVHVGMHVESSIGRASVCAEGVAIGAAVSAGEGEIDTIAAVLGLGDDGWRVVAPCGLCRELIGDYGPHAHVVHYDGGRVERVPVAALLPGKTRRRWDA
ncbi:cytidine deaminase [Patulibacter sp. S7RM1-6]